MTPRCALIKARASLRELQRNRLALNDPAARAANARHLAELGQRLRGLELLTGIRP